MRIRYRILLAIAVTLGLTSSLIYTVFSKPMLESFATLEDQRSREDVIRVDQTLQQALDQIHGKSIDWANWDDSYQFMSDHNPAFVKSNLAPAALRDLDIDLILLLGSNRKVVHELSAPPHSQETAIHAAELLGQIKEDATHPIFQNAVDGTSGVVMYRGLPVAISVRPIRNTESSATHRGWLLFGKLLGDSALAEIRSVTRQDVAILPITNLEAKHAARSLTGQVAYLRALDDHSMAGYSLIHDVTGKPAFLLKTSFPRRVWMQGSAMVGALTYQLLAIGALFGVVIIVVVERCALSRLFKLSQQVEGINDLAGGSRVTLAGQDELSQLATRINEMLHKLEVGAAKLREREEQLSKHNDNLERTVQERTMQIEHQAFHDKLTGLPNRALFMDRISLALEKVRRNQLGTAALFIDLDNFKLVNDSLGHDVGDQLLIAIASRLVDAVRPGDTVARLGGDEFTILLEDLETVEEAEEIGQRILASLKKPIELGNRETFACASIGVAFTNDATVGEVALLKNADTAMYRAKAGGKSSCVLFDESMHDHAIERLELETDLRKALLNQELFVHYQPLIDLRTNALLGSEALARWRHPIRGDVPPDVFIPIAEDTGLIISLGYWILEEACEQAAQWQASLGVEEFVMSVNLSGKQLQREDIVDRVREILERTGLKPSTLKLEITESVLIEDRNEVVAKMWQLKELGVRLALDDFGTGYSSLSTLRSFPIDTLKIDRAFISRIGEEDEAMAIIEAILALARTMDMDVTGEGVETPYQEGIIREMGCQSGQGFLYDRPLSALEFGQRFIARDTSGGEQAQAA